MRDLYKEKYFVLLRDNENKRIRYLKIFRWIEDLNVKYEVIKFLEKKIIM